MDLAPAFYQIFSGYQRAHGQYLLEGAEENARGKLEGRGVTRKAPATLALFERHLAGEYSLGVTPIREDSTCRFGAIDVDDYPLDHLELAARVREAELPLICTRTKSGGAHLYCFTKVPVPARLLREKLREWAIALGYGDGYRKKHKRDIEIFPKQDEILSEDDAGSWINLPYFDAERTMRPAYGRERPLTPEEFVAFVTAISVADVEALVATSAKTNRPDGAEDQHPDLPGAPPCLAVLTNRGVPPGTRNNAMFNYGVYFKKRLPDGEWQEALRAFALAHLASQDVREVEATVKSVARREYGYKCKDVPICDVCDKKTCKTREFGVGGGGEKGVRVDELGLTFGSIAKVLTKPVIWLWEVDGEIIDFETTDLMNQRMFQARVLEALDKWPPGVKPKEWRTFVQNVASTAEIMEVPDDATASGQLWDFLVRFCTSRVAGRNLDELLLGKPYTDGERSFFVASDFVSYLVQHRFPNRVNERVVYLALRDRGLLHHRAELKGKTLSYWSVPALRAETQKEAHAVPEAKAEEPM